MTVEYMEQAGGGTSRRIAAFFESLTVKAAPKVNHNWLNELYASSLASGVTDIPKEEFFDNLRIIARSK